MALSSINPSSGEVLESFEEATPATLERVLAHAWQAFLGWRECTFAERAERLREAARALRAKKAEYARLMALEMGKPVTQGEAEVEKCAWGCEYYAEHAARFLAPEPRETDAARSYVRFDPLGPVLAVMPWNFPFWQVFRLDRKSTRLNSSHSQISYAVFCLKKKKNKAAYRQDEARVCHL